MRAVKGASGGETGQDMTTRHNPCVVAATAMLLAVSTAQAATIHVDVANCPGPGDGSVGDPYCSIQTAIDNAVDTDEIVVAEGTYFENINFLGKAITVRSTDPNNAGVVQSTIINAAGSGTVVTCSTGEGPGTVLDGFTVTGGNDTFGGGMFNGVNTAPTVTNCTFSQNSAAAGGGMFNNTISGPMVTNCTFTANTAPAGAGMFNNRNTSPTLTNCTFCGNKFVAVEGGFVDGGGNNIACVLGACCLNDSCIVAVEVFCITAGGTYQGDNTICEAATCPTPCPADVDNDGIVGINDFLDLLAAWGPCP